MEHIGTEHIKGLSVDLGLLFDHIQGIRMRRRARVLYAILSPEDYRHVSYEAYKGITIRVENGEFPRLQQMFGVQVTLDTQLPRGDVIFLYAE